MSFTLIIDTIQPQYHLSLNRGDERLASVSGDQKTKTSLDITEKIRQLLSRASVNIRDLEAVRVYDCPVSVTGAQVGQATAEALALGAGIPLQKVDLRSVIKNSITPAHPGAAYALIKISERYYAWTRFSEPEIKSDAYWKQGTFAGFRDEITAQTATKNIYISNQVPSELFSTDEDLRKSKIFSLASDNESQILDFQK